MKYIDAYLRKKKPETFMDYAPGEIPKKTQQTTVGAIHESPAKNNTITTVTPAKIHNTYTTSNRDLQNIHRNRNNSTVMPSRPERKRSGEISKRFLDYARNDRNETQNDPYSTANETYSATPYGSPVKIVGDNVTKKDYDDFWNAFREESTGEKLNWAANQMQTKVQSIPQAQPREDEREYINYDIEAAKERLQNGKEWSERFRQAKFNGTENTLRAEYEKLQEDIIRAQEIQEKYKVPQSGNISAFTSKPSQMQTTEPSLEELKGKLRDIEGARNGDESSEWFKRLDAAWKSGDPEFYQAVEREFLAQKEMVYEKLGLRDTGQIFKDSLKNNSPMLFEHIAGLPLPEAEYSYASRIKDNALVDSHSTEGLFNMDRARKALDDIPISGKISGKAAATFVGESIKLVGIAMDAERIFTGLNQDYKDDGKIGLDSVRTVAKVLVGSLGAVGGAAVGTFFAGPAGAYAGGIGGSVLAETLVDTLFESIEDRKRRREYAGT